MSNATFELEMAVWAVADGRATPAETDLVDADPARSRRALTVLISQHETDLERVKTLSGRERELAVNDLDDELATLRRALDRFDGVRAPSEAIAEEPPGPLQLQASWSSGSIVVWAAGRGTEPADNDELADVLESIGGPALGWGQHPPIDLPTDERAETLRIPVKDALGWLVAVGSGLGADDEVGPSVRWLGHVATVAVRHVALGSVVPTLRRKRRESGPTEFAVRWSPALLDNDEIEALVAAMPPPVAAVAPADPRAITLAALGAVVDAIVRDAAGRVALPAPPPHVSTAAGITEAVAARLDGSTFKAPAELANEVTGRLERWARPATRLGRAALVVQLEPPDQGDAWMLTVLGKTTAGAFLPIEQAMGDTPEPRVLMDELGRLERVLPALRRPGNLRRGQVVLNQQEAWELMTVTGASLEAAGFEVRAPALSRRKPKPTLRLFTERGRQDTMVGANQLSDVRWSVLFDDVELSAEDIQRLASDARPLVLSRGRWVELDQLDLKEAAAALADRADRTKMTGAEILRARVGLEGSPLSGGLMVEGSGWATDILRAAERTALADPDPQPPGFRGELRTYQAEALSWLEFLRQAELGGCLALDMGLGKTPTVLAHLAAGRRADDDSALVIAPPAVVGNWAAEAARFAPGLRVVVHHGASRATQASFDREVDTADVIITTYGTTVRDIDLLARRRWRALVLDEAQAIKNHTSDTAQILRRIDAGNRLALTGTPVENGLGDLWAILDFTNPGLMGSRAGFVNEMSGEGEAALKALNGILVFRRTKAEPEVAAELPDKIDELDHCLMTPEQIGLYQAVIDQVVATNEDPEAEKRQGAILAAITALKQICNHPAAYEDDGRPLAGRSGKLARLEEIVESVFQADEKVLIFTHFAEWGRRLAVYLSERTGQPIACYDGSLSRGARDKIVAEFQSRPGAGALVLSLKAGGTGLNLTAASHVVLYDRWWNPAVEDQARDRAWRIGQNRTVISHRLVCPGTVDERVEEVVAGKRHIANLVLPKSSSLSDLGSDQLRQALGIDDSMLLTEDAANGTNGAAPGTAVTPERVTA
ncbi:MAG: DEAD/DEAH box helicase [Desertimonas sp.]